MELAAGYEPSADFFKAGHYLLMDHAGWQPSPGYTPLPPLSRWKTPCECSS